MQSRTIEITIKSCTDWGSLLFVEQWTQLVIAKLSMYTCLCRNSDATTLHNYAAVLRPLCQLNSILMLAASNAGAGVII